MAFRGPDILAAPELDQPLERETRAVSIDDLDRSETVTAETDHSASAPNLGLSRTEIGASPIFTHVWPDCADLNAELRRVVLERMATSPGLNKSNCGGWHSETNLQLWEDPAIATLLERMHTMLRSVVRRTVDDPDDELLEGWDVEAWANVNQLGDSAAAHVHSGGVNMWAAVYYVDCGQQPECVTSGFTRFMDMSGIPRPISARRRVVASTPDLSRGSSVSVEGCADRDVIGNDEVELVPTPGKMVVFPATLPHYVTTYNGTDKRITIAFNLRHTKFVVSDFENRYSRRRALWRNYRGPMLIMFEGKRKFRSALAAVVPVEKWPAGLRRKLLG